MAFPFFMISDHSTLHCYSDSCLDKATLLASTVTSQVVVYSVPSVSS